MSVGSLPRKEVNSPEAEVYPCGFLVPPRIMTTTIIPDCDEPDLSPLAFHIRAQRQWHCPGGLPQATLADVAKTLCFLTDMDTFATFNEAYVAGFGKARPARSTIGVAALPLGGAVEIEAWAFKPL